MDGGDGVMCDLIEVTMPWDECRQWIRPPYPQCPNPPSDSARPLGAATESQADDARHIAETVLAVAPLSEATTRTGSASAAPTSHSTPCAETAKLPV